MEQACFSNATKSSTVHFAPLIRSQFVTLRIDSDAAVCEELISCIERAIEDEKSFQALLSPVEITSPQSTTTPTASSSQPGYMSLSTTESVLRVMLSIESIQPQVSGALLSKIIADPEATICAAGKRGRGAERSAPLMILAQFRWLERIVDHGTFVEQILAILDTSGAQLKAEIINLIPEIFDDRGHRIVAPHLLGLLQEERSLTPAILEALSNLVLPSEMLESIRSDTLLTLCSAKPQDVPMTLKFLLQTATPDNLQLTARAVRENLDLSTVLCAEAPSSLFAEADSDIGVLVIDAFRAAIRQNHAIGVAFLKELQGLRTAQDHTLLDLWLLIVLHSLDQFTKPAELLLKKKLSSGRLSQKLVSRACCDASGAVLEHFFSSVMAIASRFLGNAVASIQAFSKTVFERGFLLFGDDFHRQEILRTLLLHFGSGTKAETAAALDVFFRLTEVNAPLLLRYQIFFQGLLDYTSHLLQDQVEKVYLLLCNLAFHPSNAETALRDSIRMIIQKQLSSNQLPVKRVGIIGHLQLIRLLLKKPASSHHGPRSSSSISISISTSKPPPPPSHTQEVLDLIKRCIDSTRCSSPICMAFFLQELRQLISPFCGTGEEGQEEGQDQAQDGAGDLLITRELSSELDHLADDEFGPFLTRIDDLDEDQRANVQLDLSSMASSSEVGALVAINFEKFYDPSTHHISLPRGELILRLGALLRFFGGIRVDGQATAPAALLPCGLLLPSNIAADIKNGTLPEIPSHTLFFQIFFLINWLREVLNNFAATDHPEQQAMVLARLQQLISLEHLLEYGLQTLAMPVPLLHPFLPPLTTTRPRQAPCISDLASCATKHLDRIRCYLYPFDLSLFRIFAYSSPSASASVPAFSPIQPHALRFLLDELHRKLSFCVQVAWRDEKNAFPLSWSKSKYSPMEAQRITKSPSRLLSLLAHRIVPAVVTRLEGFRHVLSDHLRSVSGTAASLESPPEPLPVALSPDLLRRAFQCLTLPLKLKDRVEEAHIKQYIAAMSKLSLQPSSSSSSSSSSAHRHQPEAYHISDLVHRCFTFWRNYEQVIQDFSAMRALLELLDRVLSMAPSPSLSAALSEVAMNCLRKHWSVAGSSTPAKVAASDLGYVLEIGINRHPNPLERIESFLSTVFPEWMARESASTSTSPSSRSSHDPSAHLPLLTTHSLPTFFKVVLYAIGTECKSLAALVKSNGHRVPWLLAKIFDVVRLFEITLVLPGALPNKKAMLATTLKESRRFFSFFDAVMPSLDRFFSDHSQAVGRLLKQFQKPIMILQSICHQTKETQDVAAWKFIPLLILALDRFVYQTLALFAKHNCSEALSFGTISIKPLARLQRPKKRSKTRRQRAHHEEQDFGDAHSHEDEDAEAPDNPTESGHESVDAEEENEVPSDVEEEEEDEEDEYQEYEEED